MIKPSIVQFSYLSKFKKEVDNFESVLKIENAMIEKIIPNTKRQKQQIFKSDITYYQWAEDY